MARHNPTAPDDVISLFIQSEDEEKVVWYHYITHLGYYSLHLVKCFFRHPLKKDKKDLELLEQVRSLLDVEVNDDNIEKSRLIVGLHRVVENTHARRRLERWSLRVIAVYLAVVFALVLCTYAHIPFLRLPFIYIPDNIMIAILTTTTANIIGLGLIVLRGHFLANENNKESDSKKDTSNLSSEKKQSGSVQT